jgi:pimeloyl-ACP methyl ester carboxylesterase
VLGRPIPEEADCSGEPHGPGEKLPRFPSSESPSHPLRMLNDPLSHNVSGPLQLATRTWKSTARWTLLIHGLGDGGFVWDALLPLLLGYTSVIDVDLRGHGDSPWDPGHCYQRERYVADVVALIDRLSPTRLALIGHSLGAEIAIRSAAKRPERVSKLVMVDGGPEVNVEAASALQRHLREQPWTYGAIAEYVCLLESRHPFAARYVLERYAHSALWRVDNRSFELKADPALRSGIPPPDRTAVQHALETLQCPKLLVRGAASSFISPVMAERFTATANNCRLVTVPRAGHSVPLDNPTALHDAVTPFLAESVG